jgi:hypothetical protein
VLEMLGGLDVSSLAQLRESWGARRPWELIGNVA